MHTESTSSESAPESIVCRRCGRAVTPGEGQFYIVRIDAVCDPTPPMVDAEESDASRAADYELLLAQMSDMSEQELMDQVHRRLVIHLCTPCFRQWIENPTE